MSENVEANVRWRSRGMRLPYAGTLSAGPDGLRLTGHDATIGINVALLVPIYEIEGLTVIRSDALGGDEVLSLNLRNAEPVFIEPASPGSLPLPSSRTRPSRCHAPSSRAHGRRHTMKVEELMTADVITVGPESTLKAAAAILAERGISGLPVIDADGAVIGVFSEGDVVYRESGGTPKSRFLDRLLLPAGANDKTLAAKTVGDAMSSPPVTIRARRPVTEAAKTMIDLGVNRLPVVDGEGKLVGILTRADLVRAFVRSDEELAAEIRDDVINRTLWIEPSSIDVEVHDGEVLLSGEVETQTDAERMPTLVRRVPGVVSVRSKLRWRYQNGRLDRPFAA